MEPAQRRIPVNLLTGFLGSGKTSLLGRLLREPAFAECAVLVNELGEVGLDHHLLESVSGLDAVILENGCICCSVRDDLQRALADLYERRSRGLIPAFNRVVIESTGMADPVPVLGTIVADAVLRHHFRIGNVITTIDAVHALDQLSGYVESRRQAAVADRLVITKADLVDGPQLDAVRAAVQHVNASAQLVVSGGDVCDADILLAEDLGDARFQANEAQRWLAALQAAGAAARQSPDVPPHGDITTLALSFDAPLDWVAFGIWLTMLMHRLGPDLLRVKGILNVQGADLPLVVHGVQGMMHPPVHLPAWPDADRRSHLVLIGRLPPAQRLRDSLSAFQT